MKRFVVALTGASGAIYGVRLLEVLKSMGDYEVHLIISPWAKKTIALETKYSPEEVKKMATFCHDYGNQGAMIASGSFGVESMVVAPCSMKTLSAIAHGHADNLIARTADVMLKERKRLILLPRETPLNEIHLENMLKMTRAGAIIAPPMPAFYNHPITIDDIINHHTDRILDLLGVDNNLTRRWGTTLIDIPDQNEPLE